MPVETYNKIVLASEMLLEAFRRYAGAKSDIDYVTSILLSGAVIGIVGPVLNEQKHPTMHQLLASLTQTFDPAERKGRNEGFYRFRYNSLKHSGPRSSKEPIKPSQDLEMHADLHLEAGRLLEAAIDDFRMIEVLASIRRRLSNDFTEFLDSEHDFG